MIYKIFFLIEHKVNQSIKINYYTAFVNISFAKLGHVNMWKKDEILIVTLAIPTFKKRKKNMILTLKESQNKKTFTSPQIVKKW